MVQILHGPKLGLLQSHNVEVCSFVFALAFERFEVAERTDEALDNLAAQTASCSIDNTDLYAVSSVSFMS